MAESNGLKTGHVVVVAVSSAAASFAAMYYLMRIRGAQQDPAMDHETDRRGFGATVSSWFDSWPWTLRTASQEAADAVVAAERLSALARTNEAIERDADVPLDSKSTLVSVPAPAAAAVTADEPFTKADLPNLKICTRRNGSRWVLGGSSAGQVCKALRDGVHPIALREFRYSLTDEEEKELVQLIERMMQCSDPHIVKPLGLAPIARPDSGWYIAVPLFERSLAQALEGPQSGTMRWYKQSWPGMKRVPGAGRDIALAVARGLHWLHTNDLVHSDLRPSKVLLDKDGTARLADAELSKYMHHDYMAAKANVGPYVWTAPEIMWGEGATPASDIWSYGLVLWQILTGGDPVTDRRRYVRGGDRCPPAVADLLMQCLDRNPDARPTAGEVVALLSRPESELPPALASRPGTQPPAGVPIGEEKTKQGVWNAATNWIYTVYGGKEAAHAAGFRESPVEDILDVREWEQYAEFIRQMAELVDEPDVHTPGAASYKRLLELYRAFHSHTNFKLAGTADLVREERFRNMESLDSLMALSRPEDDEDAVAAAGNGTRRPSGRSQGRNSSDSGARSRSPAASQQLQTEQQQDQHEQPEIARSIELTDEQTKAILRSRDEFKKSQAALVRERNQHVRTLVNFATNVDTDHNKALAASAALRFNIFEEGRQLHSFHMWTMWEAISPWQWAKAEALTFPGLASPVVLGDQLYNMTTGGGVADQHTRSTWHGIVQEGDYADLRVEY